MDTDTLTPRMSDAELNLLDRHIPRGGNVLEFGAGGSSLRFFEQGVGSLVSVESDKEWLDLLMKNEVMLFFLKKKRWLPLHVNIGAVGGWGFPKVLYPHYRWLGYHQATWDQMPDRRFDLILIDGRFRVACFLQSLLRCDNAAVKILVHDFWDRSAYHEMLRFADVIDRADTSVLLRRRPRTDWKRVFEVYQRYQFNVE